jgi:class 3 adenylate cyclase/tetratricopeptide (TPR) repeat protein
MLAIRALPDGHAGLLTRASAELAVAWCGPSVRRSVKPMPVCASCGSVNREGAGFCDTCGARLADVSAARSERRKTVTILFCDVTGSTPLGERLDAESLRRVMERYFAAMKAAIERHGGSVEKFIGDAVMAVFGVPSVHEDDALRALRAAADMKHVLAELNVELARDYAVTLAVRIGINTGEAVVGTAEVLATGDAVNVAARLEQAAAPGEALVGAATVRLAGGAVQVEPVPPLELKGKERPVSAYRLLRVAAGAPPRRAGAPMIGRNRELQLLEQSFARVGDGRVCQLFTILGVAGVGKSRLVSEFLASLPADARVVTGRCLSYGDGIAYWPVVELVKQLVPARDELPEQVAVAVQALLGEGSATRDEIAFGVRRLLEAEAAERPLVVVLDDLHWGADVFLDLVEHVADWSRDAPILLLCMARPELLDLRRGWGGGKLNATTVLLEPLDVAETDALVEQLFGETAVDEELRAGIRRGADGNPFFVEEIVAMVRDAPGEPLEVPPTIQALLAARLDQLPQMERAALERGSIEGYVFHRGAVQALAPEDGDLSTSLMALVRKELVRPAAAQLEDDDAFRFRHLLIRDSAYEALPKATRAALHERFASWLSEHGSDLVELDEIVGYHLDRSYRYRIELGPVDAETRRTAKRAAEALARAAERAWNRNDAGATVALARRALGLDPAAAGLLPLRLTLIRALMEAGELVAAVQAADEAEASALAAGDARTAARARLIAARPRSHLEPGRWRELGDAVATARSTFAADDDEALADAWFAEAHRHQMELRWTQVVAAAERAREHALRAGDRRLAGECAIWRIVGLKYGPTPIEDVITVIEETRDEVATPSPADNLALLEAMRGAVARARELATEAERGYEERGQLLWLGAMGMFRVQEEVFAGDAESAVEKGRRACEILEQLGERGYLSTIVALLGDAYLEVGDEGEAQRCAARAEELTPRGDVLSEVMVWQVRARVLARRGETKRAEELARSAVALMPEGEMPVYEGHTHRDLAEVLALAGDPGADEELERALDLYRAKGATACVDLALRRLAAARSGYPGNAPVNS